MHTEPYSGHAGTLYKSGTITATSKYITDNKKGYST